MVKRIGYCFLCENVASKVMLKKHVFKEHNHGEERVFLMMADTNYRGEPYWLYFALPLNGTLKDIDAFLRDMWCECCHHASNFKNGLDDLPMDTRWSKVKNSVLKYTYDYSGDRTEIFVSCYGEIKREKQAEGIELLARNLRPFKSCDHCEESATLYAKGESEKHFCCQNCAEKVPNENNDIYWLHLSNSPRSGVCSYEEDFKKWQVPNELEHF